MQTKTYYINTNPHSNGEYDIHTSDCTFLASFLSRKYLGDFKTAAEAAKQAKKHFATAAGCKSCCDKT